MGILKNQMKVVGLAAFLLSATFTSAVRINPYESSTSINEHVLIQGISEPITFAEITKPAKTKETKPEPTKESKYYKTENRHYKEDEKKDKEDEGEDNQKGNVKHENTALDYTTKFTKDANSANA